MVEQLDRLPVTQQVALKAVTLASQNQLLCIGAVAIAPILIGLREIVAIDQRCPVGKFGTKFGRKTDIVTIRFEPIGAWVRVGASQGIGGIVIRPTKIAALLSHEHINIQGGLLGQISQAT